MSDTTTTTITPEERRTWREEHKNWTGRDSDLVVRVRLLEVLEKTEAQLADAKRSVIECEEGWTAHSIEQTQNAPLTKQGRAAWWATIENSVQHGNTVGCTCMMDLHATDVQRFLELIESAEARAEKAEAESARLRAVLVSVTDIANYAPELNMSNYDEDQVSALNDDMINVCRILQTEAARRAVAESEVGE